MVTVEDRSVAEVPAAEVAQALGNDDVLKRRSKVVAFSELPGVPEGTAGKIALVAGFDRWIRYTVLFDNGVVLGSINREHLAPAKRYEQYRVRRAELIESGAFEPKEEAEVAEAEGGEAAAAGAGDATVNGVAIPAHLIERSKKARERLGAAA